MKFIQIFKNRGHKTTFQKFKSSKNQLHISIRIRVIKVLKDFKQLLTKWTNEADDYEK